MFLDVVPEIINLVWGHYFENTCVKMKYGIVKTSVKWTELTKLKLFTK